MSKNIKKFVNRTIQEIQESLPDDFEIADEIKFEISVVTTMTGSGGLDIKLASGKFDKSKENVHKIEFAVTNRIKDEESRLKQIDNVLDFVSKGFEFFNSLKDNQNLIAENKTANQDFKK